MKDGFTLIEIMIGIVCFGLIMAAVGGTFVSMQQAWDTQRIIVDLVRDSRWAMEFMVNEIRQGGNVSIYGGGRRIRLRPYPGPPTSFVWYWRRGQGQILYRGVGNSFGQAQANSQELTNLIATNPSGNPIFSLTGNRLTIELTVSRNNRNYTLRSEVRLRN